MKKTKIKCTSTAQNVHPRDEKRDRIFKRKRIIYGIKTSKFKRVIVNLNLGMLKYTRPFLPPFFRLIAPARWANQRIKRKPELSFKEKSKFM